MYSKCYRELQIIIPYRPVLLHYLRINESQILFLAIKKQFIGTLIVECLFLSKCTRGDESKITAAP